MPRHPDPELEQRILEVASRLWSRGGPKALTMRAVAKAAGTTTPTVYERYRDRDDILRALRLQTRQELFATLSRTRTLREACRRQLEFALDHPHAYEVLFDSVGQSPSLQEPWPSFNLFRQRLTQRLGGTPRDHNALMLSLWSLMHGSAMLIIRGRMEGALRTQMFHACIDAFDAIVSCAGRSGFSHSGAKWPSSLVLGQARESKANHGGREAKGKSVLKNTAKRALRRR